MFSDLIKAQRGGAMSKKQREDEVSPERIRELMDELFSRDEDMDEDEDMDKGGRYNDKMYKMDDDMDDDDMDDDDMDKGMDYKSKLMKMDEDMDDDMDDDMEKGEDDERREMMDKVYSLIDDLSDEELTRIIESRTMKKAMAMNVVNSMSTQALSEFCSQMQANGEQGMSSLEKGEEPELEDELERED